MNVCIVPTPITSEDDRWISIVNLIAPVIDCVSFGFVPYLWIPLYSFLVSSINAFYPIAGIKMPKSYFSAIVYWKRCNILKRGINTLPHYIRWTSASMQIKRKTPYGAFKMEPWTMSNQKYETRMEKQLLHVEFVHFHLIRFFARFLDCGAARGHQ